MAHRRLAAVRLPVGVGDEADRCIERKIGWDRVETLRIQWKDILQPQDRVEQDEAAAGEGQHAERVDEPALLDLGADASEAIEPALDRRQDGRQESAPTLEQRGDEASK